MNTIAEHVILLVVMTRLHFRRSSTVLLAPLVALCLVACQGSHDRGLDLHDASPDGHLDHDAEGDGTSSQPTIVCDEPTVFESLWTSDSHVSVTSLDVLPIGPYVLAGTVDNDGQQVATIWLLSGQDMSVLKETAFENEEWITVAFDPRASEFVALASRDDIVTFYRLGVVGDWDIEILSAHVVCANCRPSHLPPSPGPGRTALATENVDVPEVRMHLIPDRDDGETMSSDPISGTRPVAVSGRFGPLVIFERDGEILVAQGHWDGTLAEEAEAISGGPFEPGYHAVTGTDDSVVVTALGQDQPSILGLITLDGEGNRTGRREVRGPLSSTLLALTTNATTAMVTWANLAAENPLSESEILFAVACHDVLALAVEPTPLGGPAASADPSLQVSIAAVSGRDGHTVMWSSSANREETSLSAAVVACHDG